MNLDDFSLADPHVLNHPYEYYARMQAEQPVHFDKSANAWLVTRYEDIQTAVRMTNVLSNEHGWDIFRTEFQDEIDAMMRREGFGPHRTSDNFKVDQPKHTRRRALVDQAFSASRVLVMEGAIAKTARELMDKFIDRGEVEIMHEYTIPMSIYVIASVLNVPRERREDLHTWTDAAVGPYNLGISKEQRYQYARQMMEMHRFLAAEIEKRRKSPGDDIISTLVHAKIDDAEAPQLTLTELLSICVAVLAAGNETTRNAMSFGTIILAQNPNIFRALRDAPDQNKLLQRFVEEVLRMDATSPNLPRIAIADCEIGGQKIKSGDNILLCWAAANRDPTKFPDPDKFELERANAGQHLSFGAGIHRCIGAMLARMEMKCAFREIVNRMEDLELAVRPQDIEMRGAVTYRGPKKVPVRFKKRTV